MSWQGRNRSGNGKLDKKSYYKMIKCGQTLIRYR